MNDNKNYASKILQKVNIDLERGSSKSFGRDKLKIYRNNIESFHNRARETARKYHKNDPHYRMKRGKEELKKKKFTNLLIMTIDLKTEKRYLKLQFSI